MAERTLVWVRGELIQSSLATTARCNSDHQESPTLSPQQNKSSTSKKGTGDAGIDAKGFDWVQCYLLGGSLTDPTLLVEVVSASDVCDGGIKATIASQPGAVLMGNDLESTPNDLITLPHLHEPSVVHCLLKRYESDIIYTATGPILIALNPFKTLPELYEENTMMTYWRHGEGLEKDPISPHVYASADQAFRQMLFGIELNRRDYTDSDPMATSLSSTEQVMTQKEILIDQSMLVSGESGAGKTVTTKHIMKYLASLSERKAHHDTRHRAPSPGRGDMDAPRRSKALRLSRVQSWKAGAQIEEKILKSNPILESFGNARTIRNDNSSRFGKFIELQFKHTGSLIGAAIDTYLLEKVRLVHQSPGERNFHIFYEMLAGLSADERDDFFLRDYTIQDFRLTNQSGTYDRRDGVDDAIMYDKLAVAMSTMGIDLKTQEDIFRCTIAFLHASNLTFEIVDDDSSRIDESNPHLSPALRLLGLSKSDFEKALCQFEIEAGSTSYSRTVNQEGAQKGLEAFIKSTYASMFDFIVQSINRKIDYKAQKGFVEGNKAAFIGVLDIFGFESFQVNSFEQLCINYCNEALQQQFNRYMFMSEQEEYKKEGIAWEFIEFPDNQDVIDLIDKRGEGIIPILSDQCRTHRGSDKSFAEALYTHCEKFSRFQAPALTKGKKQFIVNHYAGPVTYNYEGFVEKNKDEVPRGASSLLEGSTIAFVQLMGKMVANQACSGTGRAAKHPTAGGQFTRQLRELRMRIDLTSPHYIRCLKPNQSLKANDFNKAMIADQLRCAGVLEAIRVSRVGYSQRYTHETFFRRYRLIALGLDETDQLDTLLEVIAKKIFTALYPNSSMPSNLMDAVGVQKGITKVFLRQPAFEYIESFRTQQLIISATKVQAVSRRFLARIWYCATVHRIVFGQACGRRFLARKYTIHIRQVKSAKRLQNLFHMWHTRKQFRMQKAVALWCQRMARGKAGCLRFQEQRALNDRKVMAAIALQSLYRGTVSRDQTLQLKKQQSLHAPKPEVKPEELQRQQTKAALQADKAAAIACQTIYERKIEVDALRQELDDVSSTVAHVKLMTEEIARVRAEAEELRRELELSRAETETVKSRLAAVEVENETLKTKIESGIFAKPYKGTQYQEHEDLCRLDERLDIISQLSKQGRMELDSLVQSLSILK